MYNLLQYLVLLTTLSLHFSHTASLQHPFSQNYSSDILRLAKAAQIRAYIDFEQDYCDDFYEYACGRWKTLQAASVSKPKTAYLDQLQDLYVRKSAYMLQSDRESSNPADRLLTQFYESCHNQRTAQAHDIDPILEVVDFRGGWPEITSPAWYEYEYDWLKVVAELRRRLGVDILIGLAVVPDFEDEDINRLKVGAPELSLGSKEAYLSDDYDDQRDEYKERIAKKLHKHFPNMGEHWAEEVAQQVLNVEQQLAKGLSDNPKLTMAQMTRQRFVSELKSAYGSYVDLNRYLTIVVNQTIYSKVYETPEEYMRNLVEVIKNTPKLHIANYTIWRVLEYMQSEDEINMQGNGNWCVHKVTSYFPTQLQNMFNRNYNSIEMVNELLSTWADIKRTFHEELTSPQLEWISKSTRQKAVQKLENIRLKMIGYEATELMDQLRGLNIVQDDYYSNLINILERQTQQQLQKLFAKPQTMTAESQLPHYNPTTNNIEISIIFLQSRFFWDAEYPHALRYATLGYLLANEMLRAFDATGRRYDQHGYQVNWWDTLSAGGYDERAKCFAKNHYNNYEYRQRNFQNAKAEAESILDSGALAIAQRAYQLWWENLDDREDLLKNETLPLLNYSPQHLFYVGYAQVWCVDYHQSMDKFDATPEQLRVNGALANLGEFAREMKCKLGSKMHPQKKCVLF